MSIVVATYILAMVLWAEARGEGDAGLRGVASTLWYRGGGDPKHMAVHAQLPDQYHLKRPSVTEKQSQEWAQCMSIATEMTTGVFKPTIKATHFHTVSKTRPVSWRKLRKVTRVGGHIFYWEAERK